MKKLSLIPLFVLAAACAPAQSSEPSQSEPVSSSPSGIVDTAVFAGGCFWCVESDFEKLPGVIEAVSGYTGGHTSNPTYKAVSRTETGHYEAVEVRFDPRVITYPELVEYFWKTVDPTDADGQFCDKGSSYRTAIFARPDQVGYANTSKANLESTKPFRAPIVTPVLPAARFYNAEDYHQDYYKKNPIRYKYYRTGCRRDATLKKLWGAK